MSDCRRAQKAAEVLRANGFTVTPTQKAAASMARPGELAAVREVLRDKAISVEYMYAFISHAEGTA